MPSYSKYSTFVIAPTQGAYLADTKKTEFKGELSELQEMCRKDITLLSKTSDKVCPDIVYTGYPGMGELGSCFEAMSGSETLHFVFTGHGSPGTGGKIGMGYDQTDKPDWRLTVDGLVKILHKRNVWRIRLRPVHFWFRCCNSAYSPLGALTGPLVEDALKNAKQSIIDNTLIGEFWRRLRKSSFPGLSVTGYRGFYYPDVSKPEVSTNKSDKFDLAIGQVTISGDDQVTLHA
ncbi:MAG TPA: hypothetical protein VK458_29495, partial [Myxococcaceae bacterium]|nr:hypothetical protein [Myxococcaceae bacterium]